MPFDAPVDPLTGMQAARFGLYLHFPYCLAKCPYCDFPR
jgi:oxygen-independent coproporphyrinogen-3 oxidase